MLNNGYPWGPNLGYTVATGFRKCLYDMVICWSIRLVWRASTLCFSGAAVYFTTRSLQMEVFCPIIRKVSVRRARVPDPKVCAFRLGQCRQPRHFPEVQKDLCSQEISRLKYLQFFLGAFVSECLGLSRKSDCDCP